MTRFQFIPFLDCLGYGLPTQWRTASHFELLNPAHPVFQGPIPDLDLPRALPLRVAPYAMKDP
jgi:hypothetical protein